jgi:hypothetical protein
MSEEKLVWVFMGESRPLPSGVFEELETANEWIDGHGLNGILIEYPVGWGAYDWAVEHGGIEPVAEEERTPTYLQQFTDTTGRRFECDNGSETSDVRRMPTHGKESGFVWIFNGLGAQFPCGVFEDFESADAWIKKNEVQGTLTEYPVGCGSYDWTVEKGYFKPHKDHHFTPWHIQQFSSGHTKHFHYENGGDGH